MVELHDDTRTLERWFSVRISGGRVEGPPCAVLTVDNVSDRRRAERTRRLAARSDLEAQVDARTRDLRAANERLRSEEATLSESELRFRAAANATADLIAEAYLDDDRMQWFGDVDVMTGHRVRPLDGRLRLTSEAGQGTVVVAEIPIGGDDGAR